MSTLKTNGRTDDEMCERLACFLTEQTSSRKR